MKRGKNIFFVAFFLLLIFIVIISCKKEPAPPTNPYDSLLFDDPSGNAVPVDSTSITGLHHVIFSNRCAIPGCHDGNFEPDFRTIQSTYATLVYHSTIKVTVDSINFFQNRVIPNDTLNSFLHDRITTKTSEYMPSNGTRLSNYQIQLINKWILNGAPDINGNINQQPNLLPNVLAYIAADQADVRIDTNRLDNIEFNPFEAPNNEIIKLYFLVEDDKTAVKDLQLNQVKLSKKKNDFSGATSVNATYLTFGPYELWLALVNTGNYAVGDTVYFRYYVNDGDNPSNTEFPKDNSLFYYKSIYSFFIKP